MGHPSVAAGNLVGQRIGCGDARWAARQISTAERGSGRNSTGARARGGGDAAPRGPAACPARTIADEPEPPATIKDAPRQSASRLKRLPGLPNTFSGSLDER